MQESCKVLSSQFELKFQEVSLTGGESVRKVSKEIQGDESLVMRNELHFLAEIS
jgi:hypothetical protein